METPSSVRFIILLTICSPLTTQRRAPAGIHFKFEKKILLAESYTRIKFLVPFPKEPTNFNTSRQRAAEKIQELWAAPSIACELNETDLGRNTSNSIEWIESVIHKEMEMMRKELSSIHKELEELLNIHAVTSTEDQLFRKRRLAATAVAVGAASVFGGGMAVGSTVVCALKGIFGSCNKEAKRNARAIRELTRTTNYLRDDLWELHKIHNKTNEKFFLIASELRELEEARIQLEDTQERQWETIQRQLQILEKNMNLGRKCDQYLYTKVQAEHFIEGINVALLTLHSNVKTFRTALFSYKANLLSSLGTMIKGIIPLNLVPKNHLRSILQKVVLRHANGGSRLTLAIPLHNILTYYETPLIEEVDTSEAGLTLSVMIPLASDATAFRVYKATPIPMPKREGESNALLYKTEAQYIAVSDNKRYTAPMTGEELSKCVGSKNYAVCLNHFATYLNPTSCLAHLKMENDDKALSYCKVENIKLPYPEQAQNLGDRQWLVIASNPHFKMRIETPGAKPEEKQMTGCQACIVRLPCGGKLVTNFIQLQADFSSCHNKSVLKIDIEMAGPLRHLINSLPPLGELPHQPNIETAETSLIEEVQNRMSRSLKFAPELTNENLDEIARPIIQSYRELRKPIKDSFGGTLQSHISISMTITSFIVAILCQIVFHYLKPHLPCMRATKVGMMTQKEFNDMSTRRMKYYRVIFYETPGRELNVVSNTKRDGFQRLMIENRLAKHQEEKSPQRMDKNEEIEYSPYLKIAETRA